MKAPASIRLPLLLALGLAAAPAYAANEGRAAAAPAPATQVGVAQLNEEGAALYSARDYRRAIEKFIQAYAIDSDPNLLFNIARCYEELGEVDAAIEKYENFLKTPGADTRGRQRARESLQTLRESRDKDSTRDAAASGKTSASAEHPTDSPAAQPPAEHETNLVPWLTLGGGVVFAAVGTTFYLLGASDHNKVTDAQGYGNPDAVADMTRKEADDLVSSGNTKKLLGGVSLGLAGALAATYVVLLVTGDDSPSEESNVALTVLPSRSGAAVSVQGSF